MLRHASPSTQQSEGRPSWLALIPALLLFGACTSPQVRKPQPVQEHSIPAENVQIPDYTVRREIEPHARQHGIPVALVLAIARAESGLRPHAAGPRTRGMMQISRPAWKTVSTTSWKDAWDWRKNIAIGVRYLAWCRDFLKTHNQYSVPMLAACYRYGPTALRSRGFDLSRFPEEANPIYRELFAGRIP